MRQLTLCCQQNFSTAPWWPVRYVSHRLCTHSKKSACVLYTRCTIQNAAHGNPILSVVPSALNEIFIQTLYGPAHLQAGGPVTSEKGGIEVLGSPAVPCSLGVRLGTTLMVFHHWAVNNSANGTFEHPLYGAVQLHVSTTRTSPIGFVHILGSSKAPCTLVVRFRLTHTVFHYSTVNTMRSTEFLHTCSMDIYSTMAAGPVRLTQTVYPNCTTRNDPHSNAPHGSEHSSAKGTFVQRLCGAVKFHGGGTCTSPTGYVPILGIPVTLCTLGVRFRMTLMVSTTRRCTLCHQRNFRVPAVRTGTAPW